MNIHHHHTIHICSACSCCPTHRGETPSEPDALRPRTSILEALGNLARLAALISLLRATSDRSGHQIEAEQVPSEPIAPPTAAEPPSTDAILALFSQAARERDNAPPNAEIKPPMSPLAAAFLAAFRDEPNLA